ncbi:MAG TPA: isoprenylcysteine carboxylmethyltransferase family protein [Anaerolineae bacterium]|nr:isoprenylcysteine carboxylmethyltransferase family protein [Anaerolineae bacterium]
MPSKDGQVEDLARGLAEGEINEKDAIAELENRGLTEKVALRGSAWGYLIWVIPCFLPWLAMKTNWDFLSPITDFIPYKFPPTAVYLALGFFFLAILLTVWGMGFNKNRGGCQTEDYTVVLLCTGPYALVRHPSHLAWSVIFATLPIFISSYIPFTLLSIVGIVGIVVFHYFISIREERALNLKKWGSAYREYMRQVPRWNILLGLWRHLKRGRDRNHDEA